MAIDNTLDSAVTSYYERQYSQLKDDWESEKKKLEANHERRLTDIENDYKGILEKKDIDTQKALDSTKAELGETLHREHLANNSAFKRQEEVWRNQTYDSKGRFHHVDAEGLVKQVDELNVEMN